MNQHYRLDGQHSLEELIGDALLRNPFLHGRRVKFRVQDSMVTLTGSVSSYFQKQMAQESLRGMQGLSRVHNELQVLPARDFAR